MPRQEVQMQPTEVLGQSAPMTRIEMQQTVQPRMEQHAQSAFLPRPDQTGQQLQIRKQTQQQAQLQQQGQGLA